MWRDKEGEEERRRERKGVALDADWSKVISFHFFAALYSGCIFFLAAQGSTRYNEGWARIGTELICNHWQAVCLPLILRKFLFLEAVRKIYFGYVLL